MKKFLFLVVAGVAVGMAAKRACSTMGTTDWEQRIEAMPDNAPPKWVFRNLSAIRHNTDRILELLEREGSQPAPVTAAS